MSKKNEPKQTPVCLEERNIGRRKLLKMMAATTGAVSASLFLPESWSKPFMQIATLPAHANGSPGNAVTLTGHSFDCFSDRIGETRIPAPADTCQVSLNYMDEACQVDGNTSLYYNLTPSGELDFTSGETLMNIGLPVNGNCSGTIVFQVNSFDVINSTLDIRIGVYNRLSNWLNDVTNS